MSKGRPSAKRKQRAVARYTGACKRFHRVGVSGARAGGEAGKGGRGLGLNPAFRVSKC